MSRVREGVVATYLVTGVARSGVGSKRSPREGSLTLAFDITAVRALTDPRAVFRDARRWSTHLGIVGDDPTALEAVERQFGIQQDYRLDALDKQSTLSKLKWETHTERYVYIGTTPAHQELADYVGWEYRTIEEAARQAEWQLMSETGPLARLRRRLKQRANWLFGPMLRS